MCSKICTSNVTNAVIMPIVPSNLANHAQKLCQSRPQIVPIVP